MKTIYFKEQPVQIMNDFEELISHLCRLAVRYSSDRSKMSDFKKVDLHESPNYKDVYFVTVHATREKLHFVVVKVRDTWQAFPGEYIHLSASNGTHWSCNVDERIHKTYIITVNKVVLGQFDSVEAVLNSYPNVNIDTLNGKFRYQGRTYVMHTLYTLPDNA